MKSKLFSKIERSSERLTVRPYRVGDRILLRASHEARLPKRSKFDEPVPMASETDPEKYRERLQRHRKIAKDGHHFIFGVFDKKTGEYIGQVDFFTINKQIKWANLGYAIQNQFWGRGYASEASRLALEIAFKDLGFHRIESAMDVANKPSARVAKNAGMEFEGKRKKFFSDRKCPDMWVFAANAIDFRR
ncbi:MAG: GNAT family N-acetyltransferase [Bdellovibrionota bacterium]